MIDNTNLYIILTIAFAYGLATGSFVTMASYRLPRGEDIVFRPSRCISCNTSLKLRDLVPFFTWVVRRGKCGYCGAKVSIRYPLIEITLGILFVAIVYFYGVTIQAALLLALATALLILIVTDLEEYIIPDSIQIALFIIGMAHCVWRHASVLDVAISIAAGLAIGLTLHYGYLYLRKKDALGWGDVKFMTVIGTWLPVHDFVTFFLIAGIIGTVMGYIWTRGNKEAIFPFGPALAVSLFINVLFPNLLERITL